MAYADQPIPGQPDPQQSAAPGYAAALTAQAAPTIIPFPRDPYLNPPVAPEPTFQYQGPPQAPTPEMQAQMFPPGSPGASGPTSVLGRDPTTWGNLAKQLGIAPAYPGGVSPLAQAFSTPITTAENPIPGKWGTQQLDDFAPTPTGAPVTPPTTPPNLQSAPGAPAGGGGGMPAGPDLVTQNTLEQGKFGEEAGNREAEGLRALGTLNTIGGQREAQDAKEIRERTAAEAANRNYEQARIRKYNEDAANYKLDPGRYMHNQSFFQRGLLGFAALLAGNANGNSVVDNFNKGVDRDLDAQKNEQQQLAKKGIDAANLLTMMEKGWGDEDAGYEAARAHAKSAYGHYVEQQTSTNESQKIRDLGHATNLKLQGVAAKDMAAAQAHRAAAAQDRQDKLREIALKEADFNLRATTGLGDLRLKENEDRRKAAEGGAGSPQEEFNKTIDQLSKTAPPSTTRNTPVSLVGAGLAPQGASNEEVHRADRLKMIDAYAAANGMRPAAAEKAVDSAFSPIRLNEKGEVSERLTDAQILQRRQAFVKGMRGRRVKDIKLAPGGVE